jgi:catechol 2,3-dioxygenase
MSHTSSDIFGAGAVAVAEPGSYGIAPTGYRLPDATSLGAVTLRVSDLERSVAYYTVALGLRVIARDEFRATLGIAGDANVDGNGRPLVVLQETKGVKPIPQRGRLGLFHVAILLPTRGDLGRLVRHLSTLGVPVGAGDHLVSEAFYLHDPDGLGIELYVDRPRAEWRRVGRELMMATDPVDVDGVVASGGSAPWLGMPAGTIIGHVHLKVGALDRAEAFFAGAIGFDKMVWTYQGALFFGAGGYHHHLGTNTWASAGATPARDDEAALVEWTIVVPTFDDVKAAGASLHAAGFACELDAAGDLRTSDPWGTALRISGSAR